MKSLAINLRDKIFGDESLDFELFPQRELKDYQRLKIRGSGQDYYRLGFRDMLNQTLLFKDFDIEAQAGRPTLLYLNGEFWGIYNIREKFAGEHFEELYDVKEKDLDIIKSPGLSYREVKKGSDADYNLLFNFVENADLTNQADYDYFESQVDVEEFTNYWISMTYMANYDWPANNLTVWRDRVNQTKWRYGVADTDGSTNNFLSGNAAPDFNTFSFVNDDVSTSWPNHRNSTLFLRKLLERTDYRDEFIQRTCTFMEVVFNEERTHPLIDSITTLFQPNLAAHLAKWGNVEPGGPNAMGGSETAWYEWIDKYKTFWETRPAFMRDHINDFYGLNNYYDLTIDFDENTNGDVFLNSNELTIPYDYTGTYFKDIPLRLTAVADEGYQFLYWLETGITDATIDFVGTENTTLTPIFGAEGPILECSNNILTTVSGSVTTAVVAWEEPTATSSCAIGNTMVAQTTGLPSGSEFPIGTTTITYEATDGCGTTATCSFDVIVSIDNGDLAVTCSEDIAVNIPIGQTSVEVNWTEPQVSSSCPLGGAVLTQTTGITNGGDFPLGITLITYDVIDDCGNQVTCSFNVIVTADNGLLTLDCPDDLVINALPGASSTIVSWTEPTPTTTCGLLGAVAVQTGGPMNGTAFSLGTFTITYGATDACENTATCSFTITVNETPSTINLVCPTDTTITVADGETGAIVNWSAPMASTDCITGISSTTQISGLPNGSFFNIGTDTINYETTDGCGNVETCSFVITVLDSPGTLSLTCPGNQVFVLPPAQTEMMVNWSLPTATTTCGGGTQNPNCGTVPAGFTYFGALNGQEYFLSDGKKPWTDAQSECESFGGYLSVVGSVEENEFLHDNIVNSIHIGLNDVATEGTYEWLNGEAVAYTNFRDNPNNTLTNDYGTLQFWDGKWDVYSDLVWKFYVMELDCGSGSSVSMTQTGGPQNGTSLSAGTYTITYEAMDDCGDLQTCSFTIEIQNNSEAILLDCPEDIVVTEGNSSGSAIVNWSTPTATTSCVDGGLSITQIGGATPGSSFPIGTQTITYEATDLCGNATTCSFTITVQEDLPSTEYCEVEGTAPWQQWISNVTFNTINYDSGKDKYGDFTFNTTTVDASGNYPISIQPSFSWQHSDVYVRAWIDYNSDFDFDDAGEKVFEAIVPAGTNGTVGAPATGTVSIPANTTSGSKRLRVALRKDVFAEPCETFALGEFEDYTAVVNGTTNLIGNDNVLYFSAKERNGEALLEWVAQNEVEIKKFVIERSLDGDHFETLKEILPYGENTQALSYTDIDESPEEGTNYYRIQLLDVEGNTRLSEIRKVEIVSKPSGFSVFPNPAGEVLYVDLKKYVGKAVDIEIYNALGMLKEKCSFDNLAEAILAFQLAEYENGFYVVSVQVEKRKRMVKAVVVGRGY
ncbi:MAG: HYR domain-containing protein [Saprospiraceae bacterium]